jgi:hypothetical protein
MIARPLIQTPQGEQPLAIDFGRPVDADKLRRWRASKSPLSDAMLDAFEFGKLAG